MIGPNGEEPNASSASQMKYRFNTSKPGAGYATPRAGRRFYARFALKKLTPHSRIPESTMKETVLGSGTDGVSAVSL